MSFKLDAKEVRTRDPITLDVGHIVDLTFSFGRKGDSGDASAQVTWVIGNTDGPRGQFQAVDRGRATIPDATDPGAPTFAQVFSRNILPGEGDTPLETLEDTVWKYLIARGKVAAGTREV